MATIRAKQNKYGNWIVYIGSDAKPQGDSKVTTAFKLWELIEQGHTVSPKSEITAEELKAWAATDFQWNAI